MRVVCGIQPVREAVRAHGPGLARVVIEDARDAPQLEALARFAADRGAPIERAPRGELDRLAKGARHQGAVAFAPDLRLVPIEALDLGPHALVVGLDELEDPQNFGAVLRSAVALGADAVVWPEHHSAPLTAATFRASAGAVEHATLCRVPALPGALARLREAGLRVIGLHPVAERPLSEVPLLGPVAVVVGAEGKGLRKPVRAACDVLASLPMGGPLGSLNASVAVAIALYEVSRQRSGAKAGTPRG